MTEPITLEGCVSKLVMNLIKFKNYQIFLCLSALSLLWLGRNPILNMELFADPRLNEALNYQSSALLLAFAVIMITIGLSGMMYAKLLNLKNIDDAVGIEPWIGITSKNKDSWKKLGASFADFHNNFSQIINVQMYLCLKISL